MNNLWAVIYGIIQGITEFLPVSSSGHLALIPYFAKIEDPGLIFDLAMHLGTSLAVAIYFYKDLFRLISGVATSFLPKRKIDGYALNFIIATLFTGLGGLLIKGFAEQYGRNEVFIAFNMAFFGFLLYWSDRGEESSQKLMESLKGWKKASVIGLLQILAIFPGVSRSGITITTSRMLGLSRVESASFSFLLSLPLILAGAGLKFYELSKTSTAFNYSLCAVGIVVSFFVGLLTIHLFLKVLKKIKFSYFMYYRFAIAVGILYFYYSNYN